MSVCSGFKVFMFNLIQRATASGASCATATGPLLIPFVSAFFRRA
jgi:hypothetical protein